jgi:hypothetical protein
MSYIFFTTAALALALSKVNVKLDNTDGNGRIDRTKVSIQNNANQLYGGTNNYLQSNVLPSRGSYNGGYAAGYYASTGQGNAIQQPSSFGFSSQFNRFGNSRVTLNTQGNTNQYGFSSNNIPLTINNQGYLKGYSNGVSNVNTLGRQSSNAAIPGINGLVNNVVSTILRPGSTNYQGNSFNGNNIATSAGYANGVRSTLNNVGPQSGVSIRIAA